ncbi:MAG: hypothetical protein IPO83_00160 [Chitinophagaceae bacterium]|nr:hypothetical protein [Chitinophagaceae bacterium]
MKTLKSILFLVILLTTQLTYGAGNEGCHPDTTSVQLSVLNSQQQLDYLQCQSLLVGVNIPSLGTNVTLKLGKEKHMLDLMQLETEMLNASLLTTNVKQLQSTLNNRLPVQ